MNARRMILIGASASLTLAATACAASSTNSTTSANSTANSSTTVTPTGGSSGSAITLPSGGAGSGGGSGSTGNSGSSTKTTKPASKSSTSWSGSSPTPTPAQTVQPGIVSFTYGSPGCTGDTGTSTVKVTWKSTDATSVWLAESEVSFPFDPKGASGAIGPLGANGSKTVPFDCANQYDYYMYGVYNSFGQQYESVQIPNTAWS